MDIIIPHSLLTEYLDTKATPEIIAKYLSLCGPTVDLLEKIDHDWLYHIEIITNRVDSASAFGIAREATAILNQAGIPTKLIHNPYTQTSLANRLTNPPVNVKITDHSLVPRFTCIAINHITIKPSPPDTQSWLTAIGERPLNNVIDISNELTLRYGQPVHVFDLDKIKKHYVIVRESRPKEKILTLDNRTHILEGGDIVIEDGDGRLIDLCGIMGGGLSSISQSTQNVLLFVQTYDPQRIRKTSLATQERTVAAQLFEKQPDPELVLPVLNEGTRLLQERADGQIASKILDLYPNPYHPHTLTIDLQWLHTFIGHVIPNQEIHSILCNLGFTPKLHQDTLSIEIPSFRAQDIKLKEDIAEEIARVYGYYRLPSIIPLTQLPQTSSDPLLKWEMIAKQALVSVGFTEVYNNSLVSTKTDFQLNNPLSTDCVYMRNSLIPSLLQNLDHNRGLTPPPIRLFELANIYLKIPKDSLAEERSTLSIITQGDSFLQTKGYLESLAHTLHLSLSFTPENSTHRATISVSNQIVGHIELLDNQIVTVELNFALLSTFATSLHHFTPVPQFPAVIEDLTFTLPPKTYVGPVLTAIKSLDPLIESVTLKTQYQQNYTFTLTYRHPEHSLTDINIKPLRQLIVTKLEKSLHAILVGKIT